MKVIDIQILLIIVLGCLTLWVAAIKAVLGVF